MRQQKENHADQRCTDHADQRKKAADRTNVIVQHSKNGLGCIFRTVRDAIVVHYALQYLT